MSHPFTNRLIDETSPYLLQHAHNPVDWYPWGEEALKKASELNIPILVSIGYAACHWCHVMEKESFENVETAKVMNQYFVNIKIDREERPDLDHIYMDAVQAIAGNGGWPLNVFLTPEGKPFYGGTYFPPVKAFNRSSWKEVLYSIAEAWKDRKHEIESQAENLTDYLKKSGSIGKNAVPLAPLFGKDESKEQCATIFKNIMANADKEWGGFGKAPKFPQLFSIDYLLQYHHYTQNKEALAHAELSLDKLLQGGIYDHIGGGLARYSTDIEWLAPHFEKMLYDNALLIGALSDAYQLTRKQAYADAIRKTIRFIERELKDSEGGFYAALDADSEGEEGKFYVWSLEEIEKLLGDKAALFCAYFDVSEAGNWEEKNILRILEPIESFTKNRNLDNKIFGKEMQDCLDTLLVEREKRTRPALDDKLILSWNCLMLKALCKASIALEDDGYRQLAENNFRFIMAKFPEEDGAVAMLHTYKHGVSKYPAFLDDYSYFIDACLHMYELTYDTQYLQKAKECSAYVLESFSDEQPGLLFFTHQEQLDIIVRKKEVYDSAIPSGNSVMAHNLLRLSIIYDIGEWKQYSDAMLGAIVPLLLKYPASFGHWATLFLQLTEGIEEISVLGPGHLKAAKEIANHYLPGKLLMVSEAAATGFPMLKNAALANTLLIHLCKNQSCLPPFTAVQNLLKTLLPPAIA